MTGTVVEESYISKNGSAPIGTRAVTHYSGTNPNDIKVVSNISTQQELKLSNLNDDSNNVKLKLSKYDAPSEEVCNLIL